MLWAVFVILLILWLVALLLSFTLGGLIHILLGLADVVMVVELLTRRRAI